MSSVSIILIITLLSCFCNLVSADRFRDGYIGGGVGGLILFIIDIIIIVDVLKSSRDLVSKLLWILLIIFFPLGGAIIWCIFGRKASSIA